MSIYDMTREKMLEALLVDMENLDHSSLLDIAQDAARKDWKELSDSKIADMFNDMVWHEIKNKKGFRVKS